MTFAVASRDASKFDVLGKMSCADFSEVEITFAAENAKCVLLFDILGIRIIFGSHATSPRYAFRRGEK